VGHHLRFVGEVVGRIDQPQFAEPHCLDGAGTGPDVPRDRRFVKDEADIRNGHMRKNIGFTTKIIFPFEKSSFTI
jgi:hypothetical protein